MKLCPVCQTTYDDAQNFCLKDGTRLVVFEPRQVEPLESATVVHPKESETIIHGSNPTAPPSRQTNYGQQTSPVLPSAPVIAEKKSNTAKIVFLTAFGTILLVTLVGGGIWLAMRNQQRQVVQANIDDNKNTAKPKNTNVSNANTANANANNLNTNANISNLNANASPTPKPILTEAQAKQIRKDVSEALNGWKEATENGDLQAHMRSYADTVDYYDGGKVGSVKVRSDRQKAFETYPDIDIKLENIKITPDPSGGKAVVVLDKSWTFKNDEKTTEGSVQQQLTLEKIGGRWLITGEKDLKVYYEY